MMKKLLLLTLSALLGLCPVASAATGREAYESFAYASLMNYMNADNENIAISPISAYLALSMAMRGAQGETLKQFEKVLGITGGDALKSAEKLTAAIESAGEHSTLILANALWLDDTVAPNDAFIEELKTAFSSEINLEDLQAPNVVSKINHWISEKTGGLIPDILSEIGKDDALILINTLYMKAHWAEPFFGGKTKPGDFTRADGEKISTDFMRLTDTEFAYFSNDEYEAAVLPYAGKKLAFVAIRPLAGSLEGFEMNAEVVKNALKSEKQPINLRLPKFESRFNTEMKPMLIDMGLTDAFLPRGADFSRFGEADENLFISSVLQEVVIRVNEEGTEAAAATLVLMEKATEETAPPKDVWFDTPFIYAVVDMADGLPLFIGTFDRPN